MALNASPSPTADGVDKLYHQLAEIHTIAARQLAECARWCHSDSTPSPIQARTG
jgi:gamma-glutamylcysteine synthetase